MVCCVSIIGSTDEVCVCVHHRFYERDVCVCVCHRWYGWAVCVSTIGSMRWADEHVSITGSPGLYIGAQCQIKACGDKEKKEASSTFFPRKL